MFLAWIPALVWGKASFDISKGFTSAEMPPLYIKHSQEKNCGPG